LSQAPGLGPIRCQVLVVGAGPAGAELARLLAMAGVEVLLVDRLPDLAEAAFSSAALPLETLSDFGLPSDVVATRWRGWQLVGPGDQARQWWAESPLGAVLDFGRLRQWLAAEALAWGAGLHLGWRAVASWADGGEQVCQLMDASGRSRQVRSRWVVDATGERRVLMGEPRLHRDPLVSGLGVEWLLAVEPSQWQSWADRVSFFLGSRWVAQGYGWVFPMAPGQLKLGVCRLQGNRQPGAPEQGGLAPLGVELKRLLRYCQLDGARVLDRHGGRIRSTVRRREPHQHGRVLGLGDAVSTANLLGGEGIRHALSSARVLAPLLVEACHSANEGGLRAYPARLRRALGWRWSLSGRLARRTWQGLADQAGDRRLERLLRGLETAKAEDLSALLFGYRFERYGLKALPYLMGLR
jgi:flavin-dependent dehydrogenase